jgi:hypothetical protein
MNVKNEYICNCSPQRNEEKLSKEMEAHFCPEIMKIINPQI